MKEYFYLLSLVGILFLLSCKKTPANNCVKGAVNTNCTCPLVSIPVCGCNNITYNNSCTAECDGITTYTAGRCP